MAELVVLPEVQDDLDRFITHLLAHDATSVGSRIGDLVAALDVLRSSPGIGRPAGEGKRELVIGSGSRGYIALYRHVREIDCVFVLAIRHQSEQGWR
jgi:plasmid stabilization system protein ParE